MQRFRPFVVSAVLLAVSACGGRESPEPRREPAEAPRAAVVAPVAPVADAAMAGPAPSAPAAPAAPVEIAAAPSGGIPGTSGAEAAPTRSAPAASASESDAAAILTRAERVWSGVRAFRADFVQDLSVPLMGTEQRSRGQVLHRRPDRFLMEFSDPAGDVVVVDGAHLWMYYPSTDRTQVVRAAASAAGGQMDLQREFLDDPTARYTVTLAGEEAVGGRPAYRLVLVPKGTSPYQRIRVWVDREDHLVRRFELTEENGSVRRLQLSNLRLNPELPDELFRFTPPPGAQVFDQ